MNPQDLFDPAQFRHSGHTLIDLLANHLEANLRDEDKVVERKAETDSV